MCFSELPRSRWYCRATFIAVSTASEPPEARKVVFKLPGAFWLIRSHSSARGLFESTGWQ